MESLKYLYTDFLYRDVLSYMLPGAIALWAIGFAFGMNISPDSATKIIAFLGLSFLTGLVLQSIGTWKSDSSGWLLLRMYPTSHEMNEERWKAFMADDRGYNEKTLKAVAPGARPAYAMKRLERFSALKQVHGNSAMAILVMMACLLTRTWFLVLRNPNESCVQLRHIVGGCLLSLGFYFLLREHRKLRFKEQVWRDLISEMWEDGSTQTTAGIDDRKEPV